MTPAPRRSVCLDVTRLVSRVGAGQHTGIDRVEFAYLRELLSRDGTLFGLARTATGYVLLDREGLEELRQRLTGERPWGGVDLSGALSRRIGPDRRRAEADLRRLAAARCLRGGLAWLVGGAFPSGTLYLNTGHSNLDPAVFAAVRQVDGGRSAVLVHDTIPLRRPEFQRAGTAERFAAKLSAVSSGADAIICTTETERRHIEDEVARRGGAPAFLTVPLGVDVPAPQPSAFATMPRDPYFVVVGTIEPRKNLGLVVDVWNDLRENPPPGGVPGLCIVGRKGWERQGTLARLDALKEGCSVVLEYPNLDDAGKAALVAGAAALLFPTLDEGFGLPPLEAIGLGTPAICSDLPVFRETMGDVPVYAATGDMYHWSSVVRGVAGDDGTMRADASRRARKLVLPTWHDHVNRVLTTIP